MTGFVAVAVVVAGAFAFAVVAVAAVGVGGVIGGSGSGGCYIIGCTLVLI